MSSKLKGFVASSTEAKGIARALQLELTDVANAAVWDQAFMLGETTIDGILRNLRKAEFGVFVFAADDTVKIRNTESAAVRDNVILELGMFVASLGRERSFTVRPAGVDLRLPTDLLGVVSAGRTRFKIDTETAARVIVVKCYNEGTTSRSPETESEAGEVKPLPADFRVAEGGIKPGLRYVLAAPIRNEDGTVWGVVDFDASHDIGIKLLKADSSKTVIFSLAQHLRSVLV